MEKAVLEPGGRAGEETEEAVKTRESELALEEVIALDVLADTVDDELEKVDGTTAWVIEGCELEVGLEVGVEGTEVDDVLPDKIAVPDVVTGTKEAEGGSSAT